jgi:hypothetical protein
MDEKLGDEPLEEFKTIDRPHEHFNHLAFARKEVAGQRGP